MEIRAFFRSPCGVFAHRVSLSHKGNPLRGWDTLQRSYFVQEKSPVLVGSELSATVHWSLPRFPRIASA
eukprot:2270205-Amphidinium_carterae.1